AAPARTIPLTAAPTSARDTKCFMTAPFRETPAVHGSVVGERDLRHGAATPAVGVEPRDRRAASSGRPRSGARTLRHLVADDRMPAMMKNVSVPMPTQPSTIPAVAMPPPPWVPRDSLICFLAMYPNTNARIE